VKRSVRKIISGGQTGADIAGIDAALSLGIDYGGSIPRGRRTEDGTLPEKYNKIIELETTSYPVRTEKNVVDSDATLIFTYNKMGSGSALTIKLAKKHKKPFLHINIEKTSNMEAVKKLSQWLDKVKPLVLNLAGSRESSSQGIYNRVYEILMEVLKNE
jgi:hypothetical protein